MDYKSLSEEELERLVVQKDGEAIWREVYVWELRA